MELRPAGSTPSRRMSADWFTGTVWQDPIIEAPEPARLRAALVTFEAGARTAWHTHPLGQTLYVVSGVGHGAAPTTAMVHVAMQEALDGKHVEWMEQVSQEQYTAAVAR
jgi:quercetin dioxygenase-like cupin family protein